MQVDRKVKTLRNIIILLLILFALSLFFTIRFMREKSETYTHNIQMKGELDSLMVEYQTIKTQNSQFVEQLSERDSIIQANSIEIQKLINSQADYRKVKRKLDLLRNITQDYVHRIDSLIVVNEELAVENKAIKEEITKERQRNQELSRVNTELDEKVSQASVFKAYNLRAFGVRERAGKEVETTRADRINKVLIEFTLSENKIMQAGPKIIYARIARPDGLVMAEGDIDEYAFIMKGDTLQYSIKQDIEYNNASQEVQMFWQKRDSKTPAMQGVYNVSLFIDEAEIGRTSFELK